jgi:hypothetical protein
MTDEKPPRPFMSVSTDYAAIRKLREEMFPRPYPESVERELPAAPAPDPDYGCGGVTVDHGDCCCG